MKKVFPALLLAFLLLSGSCSLPGAVTTPGGLPGGETGTREEVTASVPETEETADLSGFDENSGFDERGYLLNVRALGYVTLCDYKSLEIPEDALRVSEEDLQNEIDSLLENYGEYEKITDKVIENGDSVNIDFIGSVDGVPFDGGSTGGAGTTVTIGLTNYFDDFLEQLIGHRPGDAFDVEVTFPDNFGQEDLNGKDAVFATTINYVIGEDVLPEVNADFVKNKLSGSAWKNERDVIDALTDLILQGQMREYLESTLPTLCAVKEIPESAMEYEETLMLVYYDEYAKSIGMTLDTYIKAYQGVTSVSELKDKFRETNEGFVRNMLIYQAIAETEGIIGTKDSARAYLKTTGIDDVDSYEDANGANYLHLLAMQHDVIAKLISYYK